MESITNFKTRQWQDLPLEQAMSLIPISEDYQEAHYLIKMGMVDPHQSYIHVVGYESTRTSTGQHLIYEGVVRSAMFIQSNFDQENKRFVPEYSMTRFVRALDDAGLTKKLSQEMMQHEVYLDFLLEQEVD